MNVIEQQIWDAAMRRVSVVFEIPIGAICSGQKFGEDLKCSFVSDFRRNELDRINDDIRDVLDHKATKDIASGALVIRTVEDYCRHMVRCYETKPKAVKQVLDIEK